MWFSIFPHKEGAFVHHLEIGPFPSEFVLISVLGPFLSDYKELGRSREVVDFLKYNIFRFTFFLFQVQDGGAYSLGLDDPPDAIDLYIAPLS